MSKENQETETSAASKALSTQPCSVYVDAPIWPYGRMMMCHMISEDIDALHAMADKIGVSRRHFQSKGRWPHYDICKSKRALAIKHGAIDADRKTFYDAMKRIQSQNSPVLASEERGS